MRVERERHRRREQERVPARRRPPGERGGEAGDAHHPGALDRRAAARERDVERDEREREHEPRPQRRRRPRAAREHERGEQQHVLAAGREQVREARALEVVAHVVRERLVLPEHHAAQQRRLRLGAAPRQRALGPPRGRVERAGDPAARARRSGASAVDHDRACAPRRRW